MLGHSNGGSYVALCMHIVSIIILVVLCPLGVSHAGKNEKRFNKASAVVSVCGVCICVSLPYLKLLVVLPCLSILDRLVVVLFRVMKRYSSGLFFHVGAGFLLVLISQGERRTEMNAVVGGVLIIMGILMPKVFESYSLLQAYCYSGRCLPEESSWSILFEMAIAYAASLSMMFVFGLFVPSIESCLRKFIELAGSDKLECSSAATLDSLASVSASGVVSSSGKQSDRVELSSALSSVATGMSQESAGGMAVPAQSKEIQANASGSVGALPKQVMSAAVGGLVVGACFSVVNRLLSRR